jgi:mRNA-degrading endonuclease RelE of RelBE toxin-antitoxin system
MRRSGRRERARRRWPLDTNLAIYIDIKAVFSIEYAVSAKEELKALKKRHQRMIMGAIDRNLTSEPLTATRSKKPLHGLVPPWEHIPPVWQLRVGDFRVFYDVSPGSQVVMVRAIRHKGTRTTEEIL